MIGSSEPGNPHSRASENWYAPDGTRLRYRDEGHGAAVLFIHGWTLDLDMWDPQVEALCERFRCVRFDRRGFGLSAGAPSLEHDVQDALALCRSLRLERLVCVGMSQGARIALQLAMQAPALLCGVVLDGPPQLLRAVGPGESGVPIASDYRANSGQDALQAFRRHWRDHPLMQLWSADRHNRALLDLMIDRYPGLDLEERTRTAGSLVDARALHAIQTPILVIGGEHDLQSRREAADELTLALPAAARAVVRGAGHLPNLDNPRAYNDLLSDFLQQHSR